MKVPLLYLFFSGATVRPFADSLLRKERGVDARASQATLYFVAVTAAATGERRRRRRRLIAMLSGLSGSAFTTDAAFVHS